MRRTRRQRIKVQVGGSSRRTHPIQAMQEDDGGVAPLVHRPRQELAGFVDVPGVVGGDAVVEQFLRLALALGEGAAGPFDVRARPVVVPIEEHNARPHADRALILAGKIVIETREEELLDSRLTVPVVLRFDVADRIGRRGIRHQLERGSKAIMRQNPPRVNELRQNGPMPVIECVPNVSEGRRTEVIDALVQAIRRVPAVRLLDHSSDRAHNRSVITMVGDAAAVKAAVLALFAAAVPAIDLRTHSGEHPRIGAVDVVPFIPIEGVTMDQCVELAKDTAAEVARRFEVPVFLYEEASTNPARKNLEDIRRGEFEGLAAKMAAAAWAPDFGPARPHPSAGASVIGARMPLIAYNINLATDRLDVAKNIAAAIRQSSGGFRYVKAMGVTLADRGIVQVSINLTNYEKTPMFRVFDAVKCEAARYGVNVLESEIVGLVPAAALVGTAEHFLQLTAFTPDQILENKLRET